jgi:DNA-binding SARP family transcriptional activator/predicted negative regulator of RcsB-dependent stress response
MEFGLLGPVLVRQGGRLVPVPRGSQRDILAALLLAGGQAVSLDQLAEVLWGERPPPSAEMTVRNYVRRLRQTLGDDTGHARIRTQPRGYLLALSDGELDASRFETLLHAAVTAARESRWDTAMSQAEQALMLWRGEPLADVESDLLALRERPRLTEMRLRASETWADAALRLGRNAEVAEVLEQLAAAHPLREHLHALLMLTRYRTGDPAGALAAYRDARSALIGELGVEPGAELRELHQQILARDPALALAGPGPAVAVGPEPANAGERERVIPRELPGVVSDFVGRESELAALAGQVTMVISGTAGVGKTALAVHWAHQVADRFPDGQLYVNLRGYDPDKPMPAADILAGFLSALGVPGQDIPAETDQRAARYRSLLAGRRMVVILDNAGSPEQVRPLLPGTRGCVTLVTSRDSLSGLIAREGATRLDLDVLPPAQALELLRTLVGGRIDAEPDAAAALADQCCRLPLALRVAAELAVSRPATSLTSLTEELADLRTRLDLLEAGGDPRSDVRAVFSWSYRHLDTQVARTFRLAGLHPGPDVAPYAAAALTGATVQQTRHALDVLTRAHLILSAGSHRYGMHDLLRGYALQLATTLDGEEEQHEALTRLFDHYLYSAAVAMDTVFPAERDRRPRIPRPPTPVPALADSQAARQWLDDERVALVASVAHAARYGWPDHATRLAATISRYLLNGDRLAETITVSSHAVDAARRTGDRVAEARALIDIGLVDWRLSRLQQAGDRYRRALALYRAAGDRSGEARALVNIGLIEAQLGHYEQAVGHQQEAVAISGDLGDRFIEARAHGNLGLVRQHQGRYQEAADQHRQSLDVALEIGDRQGEALALARLGSVDLRLGHYQHGAAYLEQALALFQEIGDRASKSEILVRLGDAYVGLGRSEQAAGNFEQALDGFREIGDPLVGAGALNGLGDVFLQTGAAHEAREHYAAALRLAHEADAPRHQARAHVGLARACQADGDSLQARYHWQEALTRYSAVGAPETSEIRARLATLGSESDDGPGPRGKGEGDTTALSPAG